MKVVLLYTDNRLPESLQTACLAQLTAATHLAAPDCRRICIHTAEDMDTPDGWEQRQVALRRRGLADIYLKIETGLDMCEEADDVYLAEHDVLYPAEHFAAIPPNIGMLFYNRGNLRVNEHGFFACGRPLTSCCAGKARTLRRSIEARRKHIAAGGRIKWSEPGTSWDGFDDPVSCLYWKSRSPVLDIRHGGNLTGHRGTEETYTQSAKGWPNHGQLWLELGLNGKGQ